MQVLQYEPKKWKGCIYSELRKVAGHEKEIVYCSIDKAICSKELCSSQIKFDNKNCDTFKKLMIETIEEPEPLEEKEGGFIPVTVTA